MCFSNATLFYGLWVTTASLDFAAAAHKATRPPILAIDLIVSRRRGGTLEIKKQDEKTTVRDLPSEVWELVKHELLGAEVLEAEQKRINHFRCDLCYEMAVEDAEQRSEWDECADLSQDTEAEVTHAWSRWGPPSCEYGYCYDSIIESGILHDRTREQIEDITTLLKHYNLHLPTDYLWTKDGEDGYFDFDSLTAISLPLVSTDSGYPTLEIDGHQEFGSSSNAINFTPEALTVPADANARFRRLLSSYRLKAVDRIKRSGLAPNDPRLSLKDPPPPKPASKDEKAVDKKKAETKKEAPKLFAQAEPRWMLWSSCEPSM